MGRHRVWKTGATWTPAPRAPSTMGTREEQGNTTGGQRRGSPAERWEWWTPQSQSEEETWGSSEKLRSSMRGAAGRVPRVPAASAAHRAGHRRGRRGRCGAGRVLPPQPGLEALHGRSSQGSRSLPDCRLRALGPEQRTPWSAPGPPHLPPGARGPRSTRSFRQPIGPAAWLGWGRSRPIGNREGGGTSLLNFITPFLYPLEEKLRNFSFAARGVGLLGGRRRSAGSGLWCLHTWVV